MITLPSSITTTTPTLTCVLWCNSASPTVVYSSTDNTITIGNFITSYIVAGNTLKFYVGGLVNPSTSGSYSMSVTSYENTAGTLNIVDTVSGLSVTITGITIYSVTPWFYISLFSFDTYTFKI